MEPLRIAIVSDCTLFRKGIAALLSAHPETIVVGVAESSDEAELLVSSHLPDVMLMDAKMLRASSPEAIRLLKRTCPRLRVIIVASSEEFQDLWSAIECGADGYLEKSVEPEELLAVLKIARRGRVWLSNTTAATILDELRRGSREERSATGPPPARLILTAREKEIMALIAAGLGDREIADTLGIAVNTARSHTRNILVKLRARNRTQLAVQALKQGISHGPGD